MHPAILYHCTSAVLAGQTLEPRTAGIVNGQEGRWLFAAPFLTKAFAFAIAPSEGLSYLNMSVPGYDVEILFVRDDEAIFGKPRDIRIYGLPSHHFVPVDDPAITRQYASPKPVDLGVANLLLQTRSVEPLMERGLQIFTVSGVPEGGGDTLWDVLINDFPALFSAGHIRWQNQERDKGMSAAAIQYLLDLSQPPGQHFRL